MSITSTLSQVAATNAVVGGVIATSQVQSALLAGLQTGDTAMMGLLGALDSQALAAGQMLASVAPHLGQNLDVYA